MTAIAEMNDGLVEVARRRQGGILNGKWRLDGLLGVGGMAAVYAATHRNGHRVAIKVLHTHFSLDQSFCQRLQQEGYVANLIDHPGALRILDDDRAEDGSVFLVMELLEGEALDARLKRKGWRLPATEVLGIGFSVLDVLAAAHAKGIVHRDIKPDNIFVTRSGEIKVLDFGIARTLDTQGGMGRSRNGALFGTLGFMAPEQALGRSPEIDNRTDLWSLGATMFTLLTGRLVHEAPTANEQMVCSATRPAPPVASVMPEVDPGLAQLIDRALAFSPADRWPSAADMQLALQEVALHIGPGIVLQPPRVSAEHDVDAVLQATAARAGRWTASALPTFSSAPMPLSPSLEPPSEPTMLARPRRRFPRVAAAVALGTAIAGGAVVHCAGQRHLQANIPGAEWRLPAPAVDRTADTSTTPAPISAASTAVPGLPPPADPEDDPVPQPSADEAAPIVAADGGPEKVKKARRRSLRRLSQGLRRAPAPAAPSLTDDDLWDRRH
jgi:eukaryotic-like serine/threonine-protein kinase